MDKKKGLLATIHIAKKELGLSQEVYSEFLMATIGKDTCKGASEKELVAVKIALERKGWVNTHQGRKKPSVRRGNEAMLAKIEALLAEEKLPWNYAHGIGKRMFGTERLEWLDGGKLASVLVALVRQAERKKQKEAESVS